jgi:nucleoid-associated protein YgaU
MNKTITLNVDLDQDPAQIEADLIAQAKAAAQTLEAEAKKRSYLAQLFAKVNADLGLDLPNNHALAQLLLGHVSSAPTSSAHTPPSDPTTPRRRVKITPELREAIIADLRDARGTAAEIAARHGVSVPSVSNIKRQAGLTSPRTSNDS